MNEGRHEESERSLRGSGLLKEYFDLFFVFCRPDFPATQQNIPFRYSINCEMHCSCISTGEGNSERSHGASEV